jgi:hypothetical protein
MQQARIIALNEGEFKGIFDIRITKKVFSSPAAEKIALFTEKQDKIPRGNHSFPTGFMGRFYRPISSKKI